MMNDREKKVLCFGVAIGILLGVIAIKTMGTRGAVIFAALAFLIPLVPELRARARKSRLPQVTMPHIETPHIEVPHVAMPHLEKPHVELPEVDLSSGWLSNKAIVIYFMIFIISFVIGYVVLN